MGRLATVVTGLCLVLTACGGKKAERPPLTRSAFAMAANVICATATTRNGRVARLRSLRAPPADDDLYRHWMRAEEDALAAAETLAEAARNPRQPAEDEVDPLVILAIAEGKAAGYARRLGAGACVTMPT